MCVVQAVNPAWLAGAPVVDMSILIEMAAHAGDSSAKWRNSKIKVYCASSYASSRAFRCTWSSSVASQSCVKRWSIASGNRRLALLKGFRPPSVLLLSDCKRANGWTRTCDWLLRALLCECKLEQQQHVVCRDLGEDGWCGSLVHIVVSCFLAQPGCVFYPGRSSDHIKSNSMSSKIHWRSSQQPY